MVHNPKTTPTDGVNGPRSSPIAESTFSADARTCRERADGSGRLSPVTLSKCVKAKINLAEFPEETSSFIAATGAASIGCVALPTGMTASTMSMRFDRVVEIVNIERGV